MVPAERGLGCFHRVFLEAAVGAGSRLEGAQGSWRGRLHHRRLLGAHGTGSLPYLRFLLYGKVAKCGFFSGPREMFDCLLGAPLTGQRSAERTPLHVSRRREQGSPGMALSWGRFGISFHTTASCYTLAPHTLVSRSEGKAKMHSPERSRNL